MAATKTNKKCKSCGKNIYVTSKVYYCSIECKIKGIGYTLNGSCHEWNGRSSHGYPNTLHDGIVYRIHRFTCEKIHGPNDGVKTHVLHSCDNPICINPDHLRWGTNTDNINDKLSKGRGNYNNGEKINTCKLKECDVISIIDYLKNDNSTSAFKFLAEKYNVTDSNIRMIYRNKSWKHIPR